MYLILHKVRGEPAFDVAIQMKCPECKQGCDECGGYGYWWILNTCGHRAYPVGWWDLASYSDRINGIDWSKVRDHYAVRSEGVTPLTELIRQQRAPSTFVRRI